MLRDGALRATVSTGHSIVLGYVLTVALGLHLMLWPAFANALSGATSAGLGAGIVASMSRGPWVGAFGMVLVALAGPGARQASASRPVPVAGVAGVMLTPMGPKIISYVPFVGDVDAATSAIGSSCSRSWNLMLNPISFAVLHGVRDDARCCVR
jgi:hypothetical protein